MCKTPCAEMRNTLKMDSLKSKMLFQYAADQLQQQQQQHMDTRVELKQEKLPLSERTFATGVDNKNFMV